MIELSSEHGGSVALLDLRRVCALRMRAALTPLCAHLTSLTTTSIGRRESATTNDQVNGDAFARLWMLACGGSFPRCVALCDRLARSAAAPALAAELRFADDAPLADRYEFNFVAL